jgi:hypothetical protein
MIAKPITSIKMVTKIKLSAFDVFILGFISIRVKNKNRVLNVLNGY